MLFYNENKRNNKSMHGDKQFYLLEYYGEDKAIKGIH